MKDISIYLSPIENYCDSPRKGFLSDKINIHTEKSFPEPTPDSLVLISIPEYRRCGESFDDKSAFINARKALSQLSDKLENTEIFDLGVVAPGETIEDTYYAVNAVLTEILKIQAYPIIIGGGQDLMLPVYQAYENLEQIINICSIDHEIDLGNPSDDISSKGFLSHLLMHQPGHLFNYSVISTQSHFLKQEEIELFDRLYFDILRLGDLSADLKLAEPLIRNSDVVNIDLNTMKYSDFENSDFSPNGIYSEDACKLANYAGFSDKVSTFGLFSYSSINDQKQYEANLVAQIIWYYISGFKQRKRDYPIGGKKSYSKFTVTIQDMKDEIVFYKSDKTERWWMEVPYPPEKGIKFERHFMVPCNYNDYLKAAENELPDLWWKTYRKLI